MERFKLRYLACGCLMLAACATPSEPTVLATGSDTPAAGVIAPITLAEAKSEACPAALLEAGASPEDCSCVETRLYELGQVPGGLSADGDAPKAIFGGDEGRRKIAIALLRHDAIEQCGLFDPDHIVARNL